MYRLLIVDDEPLIVDGLYAYILDLEMPDMEIYTAYSAQQAMDYMGRVRIDIIVSDIVMPGMSGLELQEQVKRQWPRCKFIFLTGHDNFDYIHQALKNDGTDYILKDGHEENTRMAIEKAVAMLDEESRINDLLGKANYVKRQALAGAQRELILDILDENSEILSSLREEFANLCIELDAGGKVHMLLFNVDSWGDYNSNSDKNTACFAIKNIVEELLSPLAKTCMINTDRQRMVVFVQPGNNVLINASEPEEAIRKRTMLFVNETCSDIQKYIHGCLGITVSIAVSKDFVEWKHAGGKYLTLKIISGTGMEKGGIIIEKAIADDDETEKMSLDKAIQAIRDIVSQMNDCIELANEKEFHNLMEEMGEIRRGFTSGGSHIENVAYYTVLAVLLSNLGAINNKHDAKRSINIVRPALLHEHSSWNAAFDYLTGIAQTIFMYRRNLTVEYTGKLIADIQKYIDSNISEDVALTTLAEKFSYNSNYLSQLYKSITGEGISDYISRVRVMKAKEMLKDPNLKISQITDMIGLKTPSYFTRFFKKATGYSPQEFRSMLAT